MKKYSFLLFDADHTLLDFNSDMTEALELTYSCFDFERQKPFSRDIISKYERINNSWWDKFERGECSKDELFVRRFEDFLAETGLTGASARSLNEKYFENLCLGGRTLPGAKELVMHLSEIYRLYIVTNGNMQTQEKRLLRSGLMEYVKDFFVSERAGYQKPEKGYFDYVFSHIPGFERDRSVIIGDSLSSDILGAVNAGIDSIWYNPGALPERDGIVPTYTVSSFDDLRALLEN